MKIEIVMCANIPLEPSEEFPGGQLCLPYNSNQASRATLYKSMCFRGDRGTRHDPSKLAAEAAGMVGPHGAVRETLVAEPRAAVATPDETRWKVVAEPRTEIAAEMAPKFPKGEPKGKPKWEPKW